MVGPDQARPAIAGTLDLSPGAPDQGAAVAPLIYATDPPLFDAMHGGDRSLALRHVAAQWPAQHGFYAHRHATLARVDGALAGVLLGFGGELLDAATPPTMEIARATLSPAQLAHYSTVVEHFVYLFPPVPDDAYYLLYLSVVPALRNRGLGEQLLRRALSGARAQGRSSLQLDVAAESPALRLYERMGLRAVAETRVPALGAMGVPAHLRMVCRLD